jgi:hypothetical protein
MRLLTRALNTSSIIWGRGRSAPISGMPCSTSVRPSWSANNGFPSQKSPGGERKAAEKAPQRIQLVVASDQRLSATVHDRALHIAGSLLFRYHLGRRKFPTHDWLQSSTTAAPTTASGDERETQMGWFRNLTSTQGSVDETPARNRPKAKQFPTGTTCGVANCGKTQGYRCSYRDQTGDRCQWWCKDHAVLMNGRAWCQRHANSVKWLDARDGSIYEIHHVAGMHDRSPNLVGTLVDELNEEVSAHLKSCFANQRDVRVVTDGSIRATGVPKGRVLRTADGPIVESQGSHREWARGWGVYSHVGYLARVVLRVSGTEPPVVHVYVNGHTVLSRVPDWISNRGKGSDAAHDHANFNRAVLEAIRKAVIVANDDE